MVVGCCCISEYDIYVCEFCQEYMFSYLFLYISSQEDSVWCWLLQFMCSSQGVRVRRGLCLYIPGIQISGLLGQQGADLSSAANWTKGLKHSRQVLYHWAIPQAPMGFILFILGYIYKIGLEISDLYVGFPGLYGCWCVLKDIPHGESPNLFADVGLRA